MEVNADDMVIKSNSEEEMLADIKETLGRLRVINLKLNPRKCSFGVEEGIYFGHLITKQGIRANPSMVKAISALQPLKMVSEIQSFSKKLAALNRFLSKSTEKAFPFIKTLKSCTSGKMLQWTTEANESFQRMKECLDSLPTMVILTKGEHEIEFKGRNSIKGQRLVDFLVETSPTEREEEKNGEPKRKEPEPENTWKLFTDRASSSDNSGADVSKPGGKRIYVRIKDDRREAISKVVHVTMVEVSPTNNTGGCKVLGGSHRLLHKMGRSKTINIYDKQTYGKIRMGTYSVQIWKASDNGKQFTEGMLPVF
ncbi:hypothetical protein Tco_0740429 [Tanacetum coccineum]